MRSGVTEFTYERGVQPQPKIGPWRIELDRILAENAGKPKRERLTRIRIFGELRALGYDGGYDAVRRYAATWMKSERETSAEARPCRHAGDVRHPELVRLIGPEIPVDKIVGWPDPAVPDRGTRAFSAAYACQSRCLHQPFDTLAANVDTLISQLVITQPPNFKRCGPWRFGLRSGQAADDRGEGVEPVPEGELLLAMDGVERVINIEGRPKGVVYSHRGAWTNAVNNVVTWEMPHHPVYLWTLPLFHCNGRCFPWTITMLAGTHVFLRAPRADPIYDAFAYHGVTHLCGAPIIMSMISGGGNEARFPAKDQDDDRGGAAPCQRYQGDGGDGYLRHPCLRSERGRIGALTDGTVHVPPTRVAGGAEPPSPLYWTTLSRSV